MKSNYIVMVILASVTIVTMSTQQIYAPRDCAGCVKFNKLTNEFEENVINSISDPNSKTSHTQESSIANFRDKTDKFAQDMMNMIGFRNVTGGSLLDKPEFMSTYSENVLKLFPNGSIPMLLEDYLGNVQRILDSPPDN